MEQVQLQGKKAVRFTEKGTGHLSAYSQEVRWTAQSLWLAHDAFLPVETEKTITASDGTVLLVERKSFNSYGIESPPARASLFVVGAGGFEPPVRDPKSRLLEYQISYLARRSYARGYETPRRTAPRARGGPARPTSP